MGPSTLKILCDALKKEVIKRPLIKYNYIYIYIYLEKKQEVYIYIKDLLTIN